MKNGSPYCWSPGCGCSMKAMDMGGAAAQVAARLVRRIVELLRGVEHALRVSRH